MTTPKQNRKTSQKTASISMELVYSELSAIHQTQETIEKQTRHQGEQRVTFGRLVDYVASQHGDKSAQVIATARPSLKEYGNDWLRESGAFFYLQSLNKFFKGCNLQRMRAFLKLLVVPSLGEWSTKPIKFKKTAHEEQFIKMAEQVISAKSEDLKKLFGIRSQQSFVGANVIPAIYAIIGNPDKLEAKLSDITNEVTAKNMLAATKLRDALSSRLAELSAQESKPKSKPAKRKPAKRKPAQVKTPTVPSGEEIHVTIPDTIMGAQVEHEPALA